MNYMEQVAQMLGVELNEEFIIRREGIKCKLTKYGLEYLYEPSKKWVTGFFLNKILNGNFEIVKIPKPILDETEKRYLSNVIKPFRDKVAYIIKDKCIGSDIEEEISIAYYTDNGILQCVELPPFKKGTMYKGMELDKEYSLEDLGI